MDNNRTRGQPPSHFPKSPAIVLIEPQLGDNIGTVARAMLNCGLTDLRLVNPRDGWPNERAETTCSGAYYVLDQAKIYSSTEDAISDLNYVLATTARERDMNKPVLTPYESAPLLHQKHKDSQKTGILFGCEKSGLTNQDIVLSDAILTVPLNPGFTSLNLAQAVLLVTYQWFLMLETPLTPSAEDNLPASKETLLNLFDHLESELDHGGFFKTDQLKTTMVQNIRNMLTRPALSDQEVRTLHGMIVSLTGRKRQKN